jgi:hypothetical protein
MALLSLSSMATTRGSAAIAPDPVVQPARASWKWAALAAFAVPWLFAIFTNHVWEDYYITFRASKNLAEGHGLVYQIGERVHSFTSPMGVLLPALLYTITGTDDLALWAFRVLSCAALATAVGLIWKMLQDYGVSGTGRWLVTLLILTESKIIDFTINGMEASFSILFVALLLRALLTTGTLSPMAIGTAAAGLMWTRPDGFVVGLALIASCLVFNAHSRPRLIVVFQLARAAVWAAVLYGPWIAWSWWYYGSPVPHTIIAKSGNGSPGIGGILASPLKYFSPDSAMGYLFAPSYYFFGDWPGILTTTAKLLGIVAGFLWLIPAVPRISRMASFSVLIGSFYLQSIPAAPWYFPVWTFLCALSLGLAGAACLQRMRERRVAECAARLVVGSLFACELSSFAFAAWQARAQQTIIEHDVRTDLGKWLSSNSQPPDTVFLEPLGYIGFYSQLHMLDFPGLSAPAVVKARQEVGDDFLRIIDTVQPTWVVLRPADWTQRGFETSTFLQRYRPMRVWNASRELGAVRFLPGRGLLEHDSVFIVFRKR